MTVPEADAPAPVPADDGWAITPASMLSVDTDETRGTVTVRVTSPVDTSWATRCCDPSLAAPAMYAKRRALAPEPEATSPVSVAVTS